MRSLKDPLVVYEIAQIDACTHENDLALREPDLDPYLRRHFRFRPVRRLSPADYALMTELFRNPGIDAFTHRGLGDWFAIKLACAEQMRRCGGLPTRDENAFPVRVLTSWSGGSLFDWDDGHRIALNERPSWTRAVRFQFEGIEFGGVCFDEGGLGGVPIASCEQRHAYEEVPVLMTPNACRQPPNPRSWFIQPGCLDVGLLPAMVSVCSPALMRHGWVPE